MSESDKEMLETLRILVRYTAHGMLDEIVHRFARLIDEVNLQAQDIDDLRHQTSAQAAIIERFKKEAQK